MGYRRIRDELEKKHGIAVNDKRVLRICRKERIQSTIKWKPKSCTRNSDDPAHIAKNYLNPSGPYYKGKTIDSVNRTYAADPAWDSKVARKVTYFYEVISENHNKQLNKLK